LNTLNSSGSSTENYEQLLTDFNKLKMENDAKDVEVLFNLNFLILK
jgi:hypothetical protein